MSEEKAPYGSYPAREPRQYSEQQLSRLLRSLPQPIAITEHEQTGRYIWTWLGSRGEASTFLEALEEALTQMEVSYTEANDPHPF